MKILRLVIIVLLLILSGFNSFAQSVKRIVTLVPSLTKNIYILGGDDYVVGCTSYCEQPANGKKEIVSSAVNMNLEKVISLRPDVVLVSNLTKPSSIETLKKVGIRVEKFPTPKSFNQINSQFVQLGKLIGKEDRAEAIIKQQTQRIDSLKNLIPQGKNPSIFFEIGAKPLYTVIPNTFMDDYITLCGGRNIAADLQQGSITRESVVLRNPEIIIIVTMGIVGKEEKEAWTRYSTMSASKNDKIFIIDSKAACEPTPVNFANTLEHLIQLIY